MKISVLMGLNMYIIDPFSTTQTDLFCSASRIGRVWVLWFQIDQSNDGWLRGRTSFRALFGRHLIALTFVEVALCTKTQATEVGQNPSVRLFGPGHSPEVPLMGPFPPVVTWSPPQRRRRRCAAEEGPRE